MTALIICGGVLTSATKIIKKIQNFDYNLIIACDSGYDNAKKLNLKPQIAIGDFDSVKSEILDAEIIKLNPEKDFTDFRVALDVAIDKKCDKIIILCATGGRIDHLLANFTNLEYLQNKNIFGMIIDEQNIITISQNKKTTYKNISHYISILPIDEKIILSTENLKYEVKNTEIARQNVISVSNESVFEEFSLEIIGKALVIQSDDITI